MTIKKRKLISIAFLSLPLSASAALVPVISSIGRAFPERIDYLHYLITIPPLMMIFSSLITNKLSDKFSIKELTSFSIFLITLAGIIPYFINSFLFLIITRIFMGLGLGILNTIIASLPAIYFPSSDDRNFATGVQAAFVSGGSVIFSLLSGWYASKQWKTVFLVQIINIIPLAISIFFMPNQMLCIEKDKKSGKTFIKEALPVVLLSFVCVAITCTFPLNLSLFAENNSLGDSVFVGMLASINSVIGFFIGLSFSKIIKYFTKYTLSIGLVISAVAFFVIAFTPNSMIFLSGSILFGIGTSVISPAIYSRLYEKVPINSIVSAVGMLSVGSNLAQFLSPFIINNTAKIFGEGEIIKFIVSGVMIFIIAILLAINTRQKKRND